ncbi:MAG: ribosome biogenesis GTPase YlqF [Clostridia bacterium]|nr:ribosome biogenesis GTPase YlqF [Clostridia bacterium]
MAKAMRMLEENLNLVDAVLLVLDARAPLSSYNPRLEKLVKNKPVLFVFNKRDLADFKSEEIGEAFRAKGKEVVFISAVKGQPRPLLNAMSAVTKEKAELLKNKNSSRPLRFMVAGVPNTGKSSLINLLSGGKKAVTGDKAGVTRSKQWVKCGEVELLDSPGLMPPALENQTFARRLAALGSVNDDILEFDEIALFVLEELASSYPDRLKERYGIEGGTPLEMLEALCKNRGFLLKGNDFDYERGERALIDDLRKGRLGALTFDSKEEINSLF